MVAFDFQAIESECVHLIVESVIALKSFHILVRYTYTRIIDGDYFYAFTVPSICTMFTFTYTMAAFRTIQAIYYF